MIEQRDTTPIDRIRRACVEILVTEDGHDADEAADRLGQDPDVVRADIAVLRIDPSSSRRRRKANASRRRDEVLA